MGNELDGKVGSIEIPLHAQIPQKLNSEKATASCCRNLSPNSEITVIFSLQQPLHHHMTRREIEKYFGVNDMAEGEVRRWGTLKSENIFRWKSRNLPPSTNGSPLLRICLNPPPTLVPEYDVAIPYESNTHGHFVSYQLHGQRKRRDAETNNEHDHYVKMGALGKTMHLQLTRNDQFMSPALLAETRHEDGTITTVPVYGKNYFLGKLTTDDDSLVAVRKDKGLVSSESESSQYIALQAGIYIEIEIRHNWRG